MGVGVGLEAGAVPGLLDRDGAVPETGVGAAGDDGSTEPQLLAARAAMTTRTMTGARISVPPVVRVRDGALRKTHTRVRLGRKLHWGNAQ